MRPAALLLLLALPAADTGGPAVARLAEKLAEAVAGVAKGRPVELAVPEDHTGRGAALGLDLRELVAARLVGRLVLRDQGPRLRIASAVSETPHRLVLSARVTEEPQGRLVDLLSVSVATDTSPLALSPEPAPASAGLVEVAGSERTPPLAEPALGLAFVGPERLAVVDAGALALYRCDAARLVLESRGELPGPLAPVRAPAGLILAAPDEKSLWVLTNRSPRALLYGLDRGRLALRLDAQALPWPGSPAGLRYQPGTNLIDGAVSGLGPGPFLALAGGGTILGVEADASVRSATGEVDAALRLGPTLAPLWEDMVVASSAAPPGSTDALIVLAPREGVLRVVATLPVSGAIRALAGQTRGETARVAAAVEEPGGSEHLLLLDLRRREP